jgi:hypothetical protein
MELRARLARSLSVTLKDNFSAYGYSTMITGSYALLNKLQQNPDLIDIFAAAAGAVSAFIAAEVAMMTIFRNMSGEASERTRMIARLMNFIAIAAGMCAAMVCGLYLQGLPAWLVGGFTSSLLFILLDGIELAITEQNNDDHH